MLLWVTQALCALDRMTPNATTTQARRAATSPMSLSVASSVLPRFARARWLPKGSSQGDEASGSGNGGWWYG
jgi:hypothetical protein